MPTIIDELLVTLGLDADKFRPGADEAVRQSGKVKDESTKHSKEMEKGLKSLNDALTTAASKVVGFFAALAGAGAIVDFVAKVTSAGVQLSIMSSVLGMTPERISSIQMAVERLTGSSDGVAGSLKKLNDLRVGFQTWGGMLGTQPPEWVQYLGLDLRKITSSEDFLEKITTALNTKGLTEQQRYTFLTQQAGLDIGTARLYARPGGVQQARTDIDAASVDAFTSKQVQNAQDLNAAWYRASEAVQALGRKIEENVNPYLIKALGYVEILAKGEPYKTPTGGMEFLEEKHWGVADALSELSNQLTGKFLKVLGEIYAKLMDWGAALNNVKIDAWGEALKTGAEKWADVITNKVGASVATALKKWNDLEKMIQDHLKTLWDQAKPLLDKVSNSASEVGMYEGGGGAAISDALSPVTKDEQEELRKKGVPILVGGTPVSEGTPLPVKVVGTVQTSTMPDFNYPSSSPEAAGPPSDTPTEPAKPEFHLWNPFTWFRGSPAAPTPGGSPSGSPSRPVTLTPSRPLVAPSPSSSPFPTPAAPSPLSTGQPSHPTSTGGRAASVEDLRDIDRAANNKRIGVTRRYDGPDEAAPPVSSSSPNAPLSSLHMSALTLSGRRPVNLVRGDLPSRPGYSHSDSINMNVVAQSQHVGGSRIGATMYASTMKKQVSQHSTQVTVASLTVHESSSSSATNSLMKRLRRDVFAMSSDVGLA